MKRRSERGMREYWNERARINAAWYVDTSLEFDSPDLERFFETGEEIVRLALDDEKAHPPSRFGTAIEIGAGLGRICRALAPRFERVIGVDVSEEMLRRARSLRDTDGVSFVVTDGRTLAPLRSESADLVLTFTVFQHIPDVRVIEDYIAEIARILKPGGVAVLQWNNLPGSVRWSLRRWATPLLNRVGLQRDPHGRFASQFMGSRVPIARVERALTNNGLRALGTKDLGTLFAWVWVERSAATP